MKVALVHDYLREYGGAERVVEVLHELYPQAPLFTSFVDWTSLGAHAQRFKGWDIRTSWVQKNPLVKKYHSPLRFLAPLIWESLDLREYDLVISSSGWYMCRGVVTRPEQIHISYIHHPPRNLYGYPTGRPQSTLRSFYGILVNPMLRLYDFATAQRVDYLIANSEETRRRIQKYYRRDAEVIYPPVILPATSYKLQAKKRDYFLSVGRLTYAKRVDLAITVCNKLKLPLKIVGTGKEAQSLRAIAGPTVEFLGEVSDEELQKIYKNARALIFCALHEDFGMVPVEAQANGVPVIALKQGGVIETVIDGKTGVFFATATSSDLESAVRRLQTLKLHETDMYEQALKFSTEVFKKKFQAFVFKVSQLQKKK